MQPRFHAILALATLASTASGQTSFTSPKGLDTTEGNATFFASTNRVYQGIDNTNLRTILNIKSFALRRDKQNNSRVGASTVDATLALGETSMSVVHSEPARNFSIKRTLVFPKKQVNWPDWGAPSSTPAPFDFKIPLLTSYLYLGINPLVWELKLENGTNTGNLFDRHYTSYRSGSSTALGTGCAGFTLTSALESNGPALPNYGMRLKAGVTNAPPTTPVSLSLALQDANLPVPGLCARIRALPLAVLPLGVSNGAGQVFSCYFNTPYAAALNGATLYTQAFGVAGGSLSLSTGQRSIMPTSTATLGQEACYVWHGLTSNPNGFVFTGGSIVAQFGG